MKSVYLLRHGEDKYTAEKRHKGWSKGVPLTQKGIRQVKTVSKKLINKDIDLIFSSDLLRTKQTATIASKALQIKVKVDRRLRDLRESASHEGMRESEFSHLESYKKWMKNFHNLDFKLADGESTGELYTRTTDFAREIEKKYAESTVLIVTHQANIAALLAYWTNTEFRVFLTNLNRLKIITLASLHQIKNREALKIN